MRFFRCDAASILQTWWHDMAHASLKFRVTTWLSVIMSKCMLIVPQCGLWMLSFTHPLVVERIVIAHRPTFRWSEVDFTTTTHPYIPSQQLFFIVSPPPTLTLVHFTAINQLWCHWTWLIQCLLCYVALKPSLDPCKSLQLCLSWFIDCMGLEKTEPVWILKFKNVAMPQQLSKQCTFL